MKEQDAEELAKSLGTLVEKILKMVLYHRKYDSDEPPNC